MDYQLTGKRALVTGSSSGIGAGIARYLAAEGAAVVIHGRDAKRAEAVAASIIEQGGTAAVALGDLAVDAGAAAVVEQARAAFEGIDILVNNAGGGAEVADKSWFAMPLAEWEASWQKNVMAAGRLIHALAPAMAERGWGRIIQISTSAATTPTSAQPDYGPSKAALNNLSLGLSKALANTGITVNTISPGMIHTEGLDKFLAAFAAKRGWGDDTARAMEYILKGTGQTVNRVGRVEDIGYAVAFLASPLGGFINGVNLKVDGGISPSLG